MQYSLVWCGWGEPAVTRRISSSPHTPWSNGQHLSEVQYSPLALCLQAWKTMSRMCVCGWGGMQAMLCVDGIRLVLKAVGWKNECSCIRRRRNAYSILCPPTWISLDRDVRWERRILNTCFYICIFFLVLETACLAPHSPSSFCTQVPSISHSKFLLSWTSCFHEFVWRQCGCRALHTSAHGCAGKVGSREMSAGGRQGTPWSMNLSHAWCFLLLSSHNSSSSKVFSTDSLGNGIKAASFLKSRAKCAVSWWTVLFALWSAKGHLIGSSRSWG